MTTYWYDRTRALTLQLVRWPSVTDTDGETAFAHKLHALIAQHPYFHVNPQHVWIERTLDDRRERYSIFALVKGNGPQTVVMAGHYDTVSIENYGALEPLACDPEALLPALVAELRDNARSDADRLALRDLESGDFLPGRAVLDMKCGLAAGLAVLERFAESDNRAGNMLFIATPDEENFSHGMRSVAQRLPAIASEHRLTLSAAINLDASSDQGDGSEGRAIFLGSVGKLLPSVLVIGRPTHAGYPFDGISANLLAAEMVRQIECNPELSDTGNAMPGMGEVAPPPINLKLTDLKDWYDVTTPEYAWCTFNLLTHTVTPQDVLRRTCRCVNAALDDAIQLMRERAARFAERSGQPQPALKYEPHVLSFAELKERAFREVGTEAKSRWAALTERMAAQPGADIPTFSRNVIEELARWARLDGPAAVVCFASLYYPPVHLDARHAAHARLHSIADYPATTHAAETGQSIRLRSYFSGISDMSFLGGRVSAEDADYIAANTPAWGTLLNFDYAALNRLDFPVVNIGPWGRDYHQRLERVHAPYAFETVPELVWRVAREILNADD
ncbi:MAG: M20/M25/M40 family metallo-hydrolase [Anaerolineales bacterium]